MLDTKACPRCGGDGRTLETAYDANCPCEPYHGAMTRAESTALLTRIEHLEGERLQREDVLAGYAQDIENLKAELHKARSLLGPGAYGFKDGIYNICLGYHPETEDRPGEYEWLEVVDKARLQRLQNAGKAVINEELGDGWNLDLLRQAVVQGYTPDPRQGKLLALAAELQGET